MLSSPLLVPYLGQICSKKFCVSEHNGPASAHFEKNFSLFLGLSFLNMLSSNTWLHFSTVRSTIPIVQT